MFNDEFTALCTVVSTAVWTAACTILVSVRRNGHGVVHLLPVRLEPYPLEGGRYQTGGIPAQGKKKKEKERKRKKMKKKEEERKRRNSKRAYKKNVNGKKFMQRIIW